MRNLFLILLLFCAISTKAQNTYKQKLDSLFTLIESSGKGMGSFSIFEQGKEVYRTSYGYADVEQKIKANEKVRYRIGSVSKTFTAAIILQMADEGKLNLEDKLSKYFPQVPNSSAISIEQLLMHRSGIQNFTNTPDYAEWMQKPIKKQTLVNKICSYEPGFKPGENFEYSNSNYVLLSYIAEKIDGKTFAEILQGRIAKPLALKDTYYGKQKKNKVEAKSYVKVKNWELATVTDFTVPVGAGAIVSTPTDLNVFLSNLLNGKVISAQALTSMKKMTDGYGLGIFQMPFHDKFAFGHNGGIDGFHSMAAHFPDENVSIAFNSNGIVMPMNDILIGALSIYFGKEYNLPQFKDAMVVTVEQLSAYLGTYSSPTFPLKITISQQDNVLIAQGTGQPSFPLEAVDLNVFRFEQVGLELEFFPETQKLLLKQGGGKFELSRED
jgi:D-alanyl-D-alanine carboxypeptidase